MQGNITRRSRPQTCSCLTDPDIAQQRAVELLRRRLGVSIEAAAVIAGLAGIGPLEARR
jgi:hypothetical protein